MNVALANLEKHYPPITNLIRLPKKESEYQYLHDLMLELVDCVEDRKDHPLEPLLEVIELLVESYEERKDADLLKLAELSTPAECLKFLMELNGLKQKDMIHVFGSQGHVSDILNAKRSITAVQAKALANQFQASPAVFI
jgi:HTH-type transcriptional regulator/antitoxin HigA